MQLYAGLPILTNQPSAPTRLVAVWPLDHEGSVGEYAALAHATIDEVVAAGKTAVVAGGTGLYLRAALAELELPPAPPPEARARWERVYDRSGPEHAHALLARADPEAAAMVHPNDRRRVVRALELAEVGASLRPLRDRLWGDEFRHPTALFALAVPPGELAARVAARTREMFDRGVEQEVAAALSGRVSTTAGEAIGLREIATLPREEAIEAVERRTLAYAAYQRKWLRRLSGATVLDGTGTPEEIAAEILARRIDSRGSVHHDNRGREP
jgi:tRNA dimethylallyltransferase